MGYKALSGVESPMNLAVSYHLNNAITGMGRQYKLTISDQDFYLDLLFYHLKMRCFIVFDLKKGDFKPGYAGKMNFYCSAGHYESIEHYIDYIPIFIT